MDTLIIGFGHKAQRGKDTAVQSILAKFSGEYDVRRYAFADELKVEVYDGLYSMNEDARKGIGHTANVGDFMTIPNPDEPPVTTVAEKVAWVDSVKSDPVMRRLLQYWGTELRRNSDPFYWVKKVRERIASEKPQIALISDVRFMNEIHFIKSYGGYIVSLERSGYELDVPETANKHRSECELDGKKYYDVLITASDGDVDEVRKCAVETFEMIIRHTRGGSAVLRPGEGERLQVSTPFGLKEVDFETFKKIVSGKYSVEQIREMLGL